MHMLFRRNFQRHGFQTNIYACGVDLFNKPSGILGAGEFFLKIVKAKAIVDTLVQNAAQFTVPLYNADGAAACLPGSIRSRQPRRTAAVGIEMGLQGIWPGAPYLVFVILYFVIAFLFAKDRGTALDKVGKILTPIMTIILFILVVKGAVSPIGTPGAASVDNAFVNSFLGGYSTGDVLVSFLAAGVFFDSIKRKGYEGEAFRKAHVRACLIAAVCLAIVYGGLLYMGACVSTEYTPDSISNANLLLAIIRSSGGQIAIYGLCLSVVLACLTTAISQITAVADFYETATHGKLSYKVLVMIVPIVTTIVASFGLDTIVSLTSPWFSFFYPITLVMTILGIFEKKIPNDGAFKGAVYFTVIYAVLDLPHEYGFGFLDPVLNHIPLYGLGFGWIVPAIVGFIVGLIAWRGKGRTET